MLTQLSRSTESKELVDYATKYLRGVKAELVKKNAAARQQRDMTNGADQRSRNTMAMQNADWRSRDLLVGNNSTGQGPTGTNGMSLGMNGNTGS